MTPVDLPDSIAYLAPVIARLQQFDPDSLNEDNEEAGVVVDSALQTRTSTLDLAEAKAALISDHETLQAWANQIGSEDAAVHYLLGSLMGMALFAFGSEGPSEWANPFSG